MNGSQIIFYLLAALVVFAAVRVITRKNAVHSAIFLIAALMGVAGIYIVLEAEFLAAVQVLVYAGGVMVLFLFVIMLVDLEARGREPDAHRRISKIALATGAALALVLLALLMTTFVGSSFGPAQVGGETLRADDGNLGTVAMALFRYYLLPFELASLLLLVAMVGAVVLARYKV